MKLTGEQLKLNDGTSHIGQFDLTGNHFTIEVLGNDKDMFFKGWTGASQFTALTLDMSASGAATFNSTVTATAFVGDGSNLTNVPATLGDLTATGSTISSPSNADLTLDPSGSGNISVASNKIINLAAPGADTDASTKKYVDDSIAAVSTTSITQGNSSVAVTDTGSNGTITVTADGNTELTINDTTAAFSGNVTVAGTTDLSGATTITTTTTGDTLLLTTTEASSSAAPVLSMKRNSSSPADADYLGQIKFLGENDADQEIVYAKMTGKILDASDGTEDGIIEIAHKKAGSNVITGRFRSDSYQLLNGTTLTVDGQITGNLTGNVTGNVSGSSGSTTGNAATATALATARAIGGVNFDGTAAINLPGVNASGNQDTSGTAATATALETARNIGGVSFDGTAAINLPGVNTAGNQNTSGNATTATTATTATNVTASANNSSNETVYITFVDGATGGQGIETDTGLSYNPSTGVLTTTSVTGNLTGAVTGNASTATALATARNIAGQSFDGTSAITIASTDLSNTSAITLNTSSQTLTNKTLTSPQINTQIDVLAQGQVRLQDSSGGQYIALRAPGTVSSNTILTLPNGAGTSGQVLSTNGSGTLSWADGGGGGSGSSYPNSTVSTLPSSEGDYDLGKNAAQDTAETPFEAGGTDAFGVNLGTVFDMMDPIGTTESTDLGSGEAYVGA
jgi:hypothetical protein